MPRQGEPRDAAERHEGLRALQWSLTADVQLRLITTTPTHTTTRFKALDIGLRQCR